ncbi:MAG TPA: DUF6152 family protein [Gammaproteobacteria bacterium]|nr:DUF6152 family protein [Gammaproteobacteria bacterium]
MTARLASAVCGLAALLLAAQSFAAYRDVEAKFDKTKPMTFTGIVTDVDWRNPQVHLFVDVKGPDGQAKNWAVELANTIMLRKSGWRSTTVKPGDAIEVQGIVARDGSRQIWGEKVEMAASGKPVLFVRDTAPIPPQQARATPRWPDGVPMLGAQDASGGYWGYPTETALVQDGAHVAMDADGLLDDLSEAPKVAPFQPWALALYENRQSRHLRDDPTFLKCEPPGGPREFESNLGVSFVEDRARQRIFVLMGSGDRNYRLLYLDGRKPVGQVGGDDNNPLFYGRSVGKWEGDTLVIQTTDFNTDFWITNGGLPHTSMLHLTERFSRPNYDTLHYEVTIDDPGAYTKPWTSSWDLRWVGGEDLPVYFCQDNRP